MYHSTREKRDKKIASLKKNLESVKAKETEIAHLREALSKSSEDLKHEKTNHKTSLRKLSFTKTATEKRFPYSISNPDGFIADPVLIGVYSATLDEEEFEFHENKERNEAEDGRSKRDVFLTLLKINLILETCNIKNEF